MSDPDTERQIVALSRAVERSGQRVTKLDAHVHQIAADVATIAQFLAQAEETPKPPPVRSWLLADDPEQATADLADLTGWIRRVYLRYPDAVLSACWLWHPEVVEELWWLRRLHADAFDPKEGTWQRVGDWHDRQRPGVAKRVRAAAGHCELSLHRVGNVLAEPAAVAPLVEHAAQLANAWATDTTAPRPEPTDAQLVEADTYTRQQHRRR